MGFEEVDPPTGACRRPGEGEAAFVRSGEEKRVELGWGEKIWGDGGRVVGRRQWQWESGDEGGEEGRRLMLCSSYPLFG